MVKENKSVVCPGDFLGVEEEFMPGRNAFEDTQGNVFSAVVGKPVYDQEKRIVSVSRTGRAVATLIAGSTVFGQVRLVKESSVVVMLFSAERNGIKKTIANVMAVLPVSRVARAYVEDLTLFFRVGDIIKARVASATKYGIDLETTYPELGVIKGYCIKCRHELQKTGSGLKCDNCGSLEQRKISSDYGNI